MAKKSQELSEAFAQMAHAAMAISQILENDEALNDSVPTNWPLGMSADEFAAECFAMRDHYKL